MKGAVQTSTIGICSRLAVSSSSNQRPELPSYGKPPLSGRLLFCPLHFNGLCPSERRGEGPARPRVVEDPRRRYLWGKIPTISRAAGAPAGARGLWNAHAERSKKGRVVTGPRPHGRERILLVRGEARA